MNGQEPPRRESLRPLRPLPSIGVPLLRSERAAVRQRRWLIAGLVAALALAGVGGLGYTLFLGHERSSSAEPIPDAVEPPAPSLPSEPSPLVAAEPPAEPRLEPMARVAGRSERPLGRARSFSDALHKAGMNTEEADQVVAALSKLLDFRHVRPEDTIVLERGSQGELTRFEFRASATVRYEATRGASGFEGREVKLPVESTRIARGGTVQGSLGDALEGLKLGRALTGIFNDVFSGKVNFSTDTRSGDAFRVIVDEERIEGAFLRYGTVHALEYQGERTGLVRAFFYESKRIDGDFFDEQGRAMHGGWLRTPLRYDHVSSPFGVRFHPVLKRKKMHEGIDYSAPTGTVVRAAASGTVRFAGVSGPNGNLLALVHPHGYETFYAHLSKFATGIRAGARVKQRQVIAYVGSTGRSTGPHLHFALKKGGRFINPNTQLNGPGLPLPASELSDYKRRVNELLEELRKVPLEQPVAVTPPPELSEPLELGEEEL